MWNLFDSLDRYQYWLGSSEPPYQTHTTPTILLLTPELTFQSEKHIKLGQKVQTNTAMMGKWVFAARNPQMEI